jgi:transposase
MSTVKTSRELKLSDDVESLKAHIAHLGAQLAVRDTELSARDEAIASLREQIRLMLARRFGASSERVADGQLGLFNEAEELSAASDESAHETDGEHDVEIAAHTRRGKRSPLPEHLPRIDIVHELPEAQRVCPHDGTVLEPFSEETSEQLDVEPARFRVLRHRRVKYRCPCCAEHLRTAPMTPQPIPKSQASPGLLAFIATSKYVDGMPLYRLAKQFERSGVSVPRQTQGRWMVQSGDVVQPLINLLRERMLEGSYIHCDETTVQVLDEPGKSAQSKSYMWVQASGTGEQPVVLFDYDPTRSGEVPKRLFEEFRGYLQTDAYAGYNDVVRDGNITRVLCLAHARRYFVDGLKAQGINPNKLPAKPPDKARRLLTALGYIRHIYAIERRIRECAPNERHDVRQRESRPVLQRLHTWAAATHPRVAPKTPLGKALGYLLDHWDGLIRFLDDGRLEVDNNRAENAIRPFTLGRKAWLFSATVEGAKASANLYSLVESAKANALEPYAYLRHVLTELPKAQSLETIEALLPWHVERESLKL